MSYADIIWGLGGRNGVLGRKKKFCIFFTFFMCGRIFGMSGSRIINFSKISKISNERSELKMSHMSEFLSEFAHSGV